MRLAHLSIGLETLALRSHSTTVLERGAERGPDLQLNLPGNF